MLLNLLVLLKKNKYKVFEIENYYYNLIILELDN